MPNLLQEKYPLIYHNMVTQPPLYHAMLTTGIEDNNFAPYTGAVGLSQYVSDNMGHHRDFPFPKEYKELNQMANAFERTVIDSHQHLIGTGVDYNSDDASVSMFDDSIPDEYWEALDKVQDEYDELLEQWELAIEALESTIADME